MIKVSTAVESILLKDGFAIEAMQRRLLNISSYAKVILTEVENTTMKPVRLATIVVALSRISKSLQKGPEFNPNIEISSLSITTSLIEITYDKTSKSETRLQSLHKRVFEKKDFYTITEGLHEITLICPDTAYHAIIRHFSLKPKIVIGNLVAISVRFSEIYMDIPNTIYSLVGALAQRHVNIIEIVSTYTELTFVIYAKEMEKTIQALQSYSGIRK